MDWMPAEKSGWVATSQRPKHTRTMFKQLVWSRYHHSPERPERPGTLRFGIPVVPADAMLPKPVVPGAKLLPALANDVKRIRGAKLGICFDPEKGL